jgi:hypothetical protein
MAKMISDITANHRPWGMIIEECLLEILSESQLPNNCGNPPEASNFILSVVVELSIVGFIKLVDFRPEECCEDVLCGVCDAITCKDLKLSPVIKHGRCSMDE